MKKIEVSNATLNQLEAIKKKEESFDDVIQRLLMVFQKVRSQRLDGIREKINHGRLAASRSGTEV